jgi:hypothetical protein
MTLHVFARSADTARWLLQLVREEDYMSRNDQEISDSVIRAVGLPVEGKGFRQARLAQRRRSDRRRRLIGTVLLAAFAVGAVWGWNQSKSWLLPPYAFAPVQANAQSTTPVDCAMPQVAKHTADDLRLEYRSPTHVFRNGERVRRDRGDDRIKSYKPDEHLAEIRMYRWTYPPFMTVGDKPGWYAYSDSSGCHSKPLVSSRSASTFDTGKRKGRNTDLTAKVPPGATLVGVEFDIHPIRGGPASAR